MRFPYRFTTRLKTQASQKGQFAFRQRELEQERPLNFDRTGRHRRHKASGPLRLLRLLHGCHAFLVLPSQMRSDAEHALH